MWKVIQDEYSCPRDFVVVDKVSGIRWCTSTGTLFHGDYKNCMRKADSLNRKERYDSVRIDPNKQYDLWSLGGNPTKFALRTHNGVVYYQDGELWMNTYIVACDKRDWLNKYGKEIKKVSKSYDITMIDQRGVNIMDRYIPFGVGAIAASLTRNSTSYIVYHIKDTINEHLYIKPNGVLWYGTYTDAANKCKKLNNSEYRYITAPKGIRVMRYEHSIGCDAPFEAYYVYCNSSRSLLFEDIHGVKCPWVGSVYEAEIYVNKLNSGHHKV